MAALTHDRLEAVGQDSRDARAAAAGDARAFERLYRTHLGRMHGLVRRMAGPKEAEEITQDVFVRAWQKLGTFRGDAAFSTWLHRLAVNVVIERFRSAATKRAKLHDQGVVLEALPSRPDRPDKRLQLDAALDQLPHGARQIFVLHDVEGYKHDEIAAMLDISAGTSKAQLHRARMLLRKQL
ncbi:MAG: RNA polymerase sigma factor [Vicinamibacterales bacterium]